MNEKVERCPWCGGNVIWNETFDHHISSGMAYCDRAKYVPSGRKENPMGEHLTA